MVLNHLHQSQFANAGIPIEHHDLPQAVLDLGPALKQQGDFRIPPHQWGESACERHVETALHTALPQDLIDGDSRSDPMEALGAKSPAGKIPLDEMPGRRAGHYRIRQSEALYLGRNVWRIPKR